MLRFLGKCIYVFLCFRRSVFLICVMWSNWFSGTTLSLILKLDIFSYICHNITTFLSFMFNFVAIEENLVFYIHVATLYRKNNPHHSYNWRTPRASTLITLFVLGTLLGKVSSGTRCQHPSHFFCNQGIHEYYVEWKRFNAIMKKKVSVNVD